METKLTRKSFLASATASAMAMFLPKPAKASQPQRTHRLVRDAEILADGGWREEVVYEMATQHDAAAVSSALNFLRYRCDWACPPLKVLRIFYRGRFIVVQCCIFSSDLRGGRGQVNAMFSQVADICRDYVTEYIEKDFFNKDFKLSDFTRRELKV